jgi:biotin operon repressor
MIKRLKKIFFSEKTNEIIKVDNLTKDINSTFEEVSNDINELRKWVFYVHNKHEHQKKEHSQSIEISKKEINNLHQWTKHVYEENQKLKKYMKDITKYIFEAHDTYKSFNERLSTLEKDIEGHKRTLEEGQLRTIKDNKKDIIVEEKDMSIVKEKENKIEVIDKNSLNTSQKELIHLLYTHPEPLEYKVIAKILRKKEKSIRNMIYEIREKGIKIKDRHIGFRKKGFYIDSEEKLKLSGR